MGLYSLFGGRVCKAIGMIVAGLWLVLAFGMNSNASAQGNFGSCDGTMYLSQRPAGDPNMTLYQFDTSRNPFVYDSLGSQGDIYNATAYNPDDNYLYAILSGTNELVRIGDDGDPISQGTVTGLPAPPPGYISGEIDPDGTYYLAGSNNGQLYVITGIASGSASTQPVTMSQTIAVADLAWHDGLLYGVANNEKILYSIDPVTGTTTPVGPVGFDNVSFGSMIGATNGVFGVNNDGSGFFKFDLSTGEGTKISDAPGASTNDGARCADSPLTFPGDLTMDKDDGATTYVPGEEVTYTLIVSNNGPFGAQGAVVNDPVPTGIPASNVSWTCNATGGGTCGTASGTGAINGVAVNLPYDPGTNTGATATFLLTMQVPSDFTGDLTNTAEVTPSSSTTDSDLTNNEDDDTNTADPAADIVLTKTLDTAGPFVAGQQVDYTITIDNDGPSDATDIQVTDVPTNLDNLTVTGPVCSGGFPCTIPALADGDQTTISVSGTIVAAGDFDNEATATPAEEDPTPGNNTDNDGDTADPSADVALIKTLDTAGAFNAGQEIQYTIDISNNGPSDATNILVEDTPSNLTITGVSGSGCSSLPCTIPGPLTDGDQTTVTVTATIDAAGAFDNTATATPGENDPDLSNNTDDTGNGGSADPAADIVLAKTLDTAGPFVAGQQVDYTITIDNDGPSDATNIQVTDVPTNLDNLTVTGPVCSGGFPCTIPALADGDQTTISVSGTIVAAGDFDNEATATPAEEDPTPGNNTDSDGDTADPSADVALIKTLDTAGAFNAGQEIQYTIDISNNGPSDATNILVEDTPANLTITGVSGSGCSSLPCTIPGPLSDGDQTTLSVTATIDAAGAFDNTATATPGENDPDLSNNTDDTGNGGSADPAADIVLAKTLDTAGPFVAGQQVDYTITIDNDGPSDATNIQVTDVPTNLDNLTVTGPVCSGGFPCTIPALADGDQTTISVSGTIVAAGDFDNEATAMPAEDDLTPGNNTDNDGNSGDPSADIALVKTLDTAGPYSAGQEVDYTVTISNNGPSDATDILVEDTPANLTITGVSGSGCSSLPCTIPGPLSDGDQTTLSVTATIDAAGTFDNTATATPDENEPDLSNNEDNDGDEAAPSADVSVDKTLDTEGPFIVAQEITYTLRIVNDGPSPAEAVTVTDSPTNMTITSVSTPCEGGFPCDLGTVAANSEIAMTLTATIDASGDFNNSAKVESDTPDPDLTNNTDDDPENGGTAGPSADVSVDKILDTESPYVAGQEVAYTITVSNAGPSEATGTEVTETPTNLNIISVDGAGCSEFPCTIESLPAGAEQVINIRATIEEAGAFGNTVTASSNEEDPDPEDNTDDDPENGGEAAPPIQASDESYGPLNSGADYPNAGNIYGNDTFGGDPVNSESTTFELMEDLPEGITLDPETGQLTVGPETLSGGYTFDYEICAADNPNNCDVATVTITVEEPSADVSIEKSLDTEGPFTAGQQIQYTIVVSNSGPSRATSIEVTDTPTNLSITSVNGAGCSAMPCTIPGPLAAGEQANITVMAQIESAGSFDNAASVSPAEEDPDPAGNTDDEGNGGEAEQPELRLTKQAQNLTVRPGGFVPYTITIDNLTKVPVTNVQVIDTPASGLSYVEQSVHIDDQDESGLVEGIRPLTFGEIDVAAEGQAVITYVMRVGATALAGELPNSAIALLDGASASNEANTSVMLEGDPMMDETRILGTVFRDHDDDGWQDIADATGLYVEGGFVPDVYIPGSTTIDRGQGPEAVSDGSAPLLEGLDLGDLEGRGSLAEPGESPRIVVSQRLRAPGFSDDFVLTSSEGSQLRMEASGKVSRNSKGAVKRGANAQFINVDRRVEEHNDGTVTVDYIITNAGFNDWGLPGTRLATPQGLVTETDAYGRYHIEAIEVDSWRRGRNYVVKLDASSIPAGARVTTENPLVRRVTQGLPVRYDFGVSWPAVDLSLTKILDTEGPYEAGQQLTFTLAIQNAGPSEATGIKVTDTPENMTVTAVNGGGCSEFPCVIPSLPAGEQVTISVTATVDGPGDFANAAIASPAENDPHPENNSDYVAATAPEDTTDESPKEPTPPEGCEDAGQLPKQVHFATDQSVISAEAAGMLDQVAAFLKRRETCSVRVVGHTDSDLGHSYNLALSERRARAIRAYIQAAGVSADRIAFSGVSYDDPAVNEQDVLDKALNRRTSFILSPSSPEEPRLSQIEDLQVDPEPRRWDYIFDFRHRAVPDRLHFPEGYAQVNFVSRYLLKRIQWVLDRHADIVGTTFRISPSGDEGLDRRRADVLGETLSDLGFSAGQYDITVAGGSTDDTNTAYISYSSEAPLILIEQEDDVRLGSDGRYRPLLEKAWELLISRKDAPLLNETPPAAMPEGTQISGGDPALNVEARAVLSRLGSYLQAHPEVSAYLQAPPGLEPVLRRARQYLIDWGLPGSQLSIDTKADTDEQYIRFLERDTSDF